MHKRLKLFTPIIALLIILSITLMVIITTFGKPNVALVFAVLTGIVLIVVVILIKRASDKSGIMLKDISDSVAYAMGHDYAQFPMPVLTAYANGEIIWYNEMCSDHVFEKQEMLGKNIDEILGEIDFAQSEPTGYMDIEYNRKLYTVYISQNIRNDNILLVLYFIENTDLKYYADEYHLTKPSIAIIVVDNYDEMNQDNKEAGRAQLMSDIQKILRSYIESNYGFITKIARDKFIAVIEERGYENIIANKFDILDHIRNLRVNDNLTATISVGLGRDAQSLYEADMMAHQALEMCLGRGGDQAAIKTQNGYEFYGGVSKAIEKRTKVKTRIVAAALSELIESSGNVIVMGHRFADLDCLGSAVGILKSVREMGRPAVIAMDIEKSLVQQLVTRLFDAGYSDKDIVSPEIAMEMVDASTLLIVVDTHVPHVLESEELYKKCRTVVVIDHHRKLVEHIKNAVIFYHEPYASSASEMVTELVQYFPTRPDIAKIEAESMMAGIMLDTRNFVMRTGVRTFEAAAYLRKMGADTAEVRKLFSSSMEAYQKKVGLVSNAEVYRGCAITVSEMLTNDMRIVAPQAADELMTISGVDASFIIYTGTNNIINVSARSMGAINVQALMEKIGGGGHQTMAAAQFSDNDITNVRKLLLETIDNFCDERDERQQKIAVKNGE